MSPLADLRLVLPALAVWGGALAGFGVPWQAWVLPCLFVGGTCGLAARGGSRRVRAPLLVLVLLAFVVGAAAATMREAAHEHSVVAAAASSRAYVEARVRVTSDPVVRPGRFGDFVVVRGSVTSLRWRGSTITTRAPILLVGSGSWGGVELGATVRAAGRLSPGESAEVAGRLAVTREPEIVSSPGAALRAAAAVRRWIRDAASGSSPVARELVPALVVGDDSRLPTEVVEEFQVAGLTHLTAVSGTNLTLVVGFLLVMARWVGVRARGLLVVGLLGVAGFVLVARAEPSVLRAAAMGSAALVGLASGGRQRGLRTLSVAVLVLLLLDPWLARSVGFALSVLATAGILVIAPPMRDALSRWLPRWAAEAVAVPFAAQVACTPVVAAMTGTVSVVAVLANLLVGAAVGPATVLGLLGGLLWPCWPWLGAQLGQLAGWCADWVVAVADRAAALPAGSATWSSGPLGVAVLAFGCLGLALAAPRFVSKPSRSLLGVGVLVLVMIRPPPTPGWPPVGWVMVACDVGQGDGLVLNAGDDAGVVVDAGPEPSLIDRCLRRLGVSRVPVVFLTHFHADHVDGLAGVLRGRRVGEILVTALRDPPYGADQVDREAAPIAVRVPAYGEVMRVGPLTWQVLGPRGSASDTGAAAEEGSAANNASLVLLVESHGIRLLLTGDAEPEAQADLERTVGGLQVDVLKVPHHGSRYQDESFLGRLGARLAVVSAGEDNDYGHPSSWTIQALRRAGMEVRRTDLDGDVAVLVRDGQLRVATSE